MSGPPTANPQTASFDLYFALAEEQARPGERIAVTLSYRGDAEVTSVPAGCRRARREWDRVDLCRAHRRASSDAASIERVDAGRALVSRGIAPGARVVAEGSAELYGFTSSAPGK